MNPELTENKDMDKKPFAKKVAGGFLIFIFFVVIWLTYSFEFKENRSVSASLSKQRIIENYLSNIGIDNLKIEYTERDKYSVIHLNSKLGKTVRDYLQAPFLLKEENCYAKRYSGDNKDIMFKNVNLEKLILHYKFLTGQNIAHFLNREILVNNFSPRQEKSLTSLFNGRSDGVISIGEDKVDYLVKVQFIDNSKLKEKVENFEKAISYILASFYPTDRELVLPDNTRVQEIMIQPEKFVFENYNNNTRYIKDENLNFELFYRQGSDKILISNSLDGLNSKVPEFKSCSNEGAIIVPKHLIENIGILTEEEFRKFNQFIFIEDQERVLVILK